ncbi:unnamed protein product [Cylicocyclus nassatus]|uniref:Uncharacterized protein n=1 Tax=Cylicocyclus nassatus TaxID=53992 RepID=A0AA36GI68_CYLNA|nr:unnamed protein product [Cylicocyclus nassatus]
MKLVQLKIFKRLDSKPATAGVIKRHNCHNLSSPSLQYRIAIVQIVTNEKMENYKTAMGFARPVNAGS